MKDARGHGSNGFGSYTPPNKPGYDPVAERNLAQYASGGRPMSSNAQAAQSLMSTLRSTQAPVHPSFQTMPDLTAGTRGQDAVKKFRGGGLHPVEKYRGNPL